MRFPFRHKNNPRPVDMPLKSINQSSIYKTEKNKETNKQRTIT